MTAETQSSPAAAAAGPLAGLRVVELGDGTAGPYATGSMTGRARKPYSPFTSV